MSTAAMNGLLEYLYGTLSVENMRLVGESLLKRAKEEEEPLRPYTMDEIDAMLDRAEEDIKRGDVFTTEEVMNYCFGDDEEEEAPSMVAEPALEEA